MRVFALDVIRRHMKLLLLVAHANQNSHKKEYNVDEPDYVN